MFYKFLIHTELSFNENGKKWNYDLNV